jgi:hypothetical protein
MQINLPKTEDKAKYINEFYSANYFFKPVQEFDREQRFRVEQDIANFGTIKEFLDWHVARIKRLLEVKK